MPNSKTFHKSIREIAGDSYMTPLPIPFRLGHATGIALVYDTGLTLFDTGINQDAAFAGLERSLVTINRSIRDIDCIVITHHHADH